MNRITMHDFRQHEHELPREIFDMFAAGRLESYHPDDAKLRIIKRANPQKAELVCMMGGRCMNPECGFNKYSCSLQFHHVDPNSKKTRLSQLFAGSSWFRIIQEAKKCILLCSNCHDAVHFGELILDIPPWSGDHNQPQDDPAVVDIIERDYEPLRAF